MRVFLDTNIVLDYLLKREPFSDEARRLFMLGYAGLIHLYMSDITLTNIAYITRKVISKEDFYLTIDKFLKYIKVTSIGQQIVELAIKEKWDDFEDCVQYLSALKFEADCIITRNTDDFRMADIPVYTPTSFIDTILKGSK